MAHKLDTPKLPLVDSSLLSSLALTRHENQCIQLCRDLTGHLTRDGHGITHVVLGPEAFLVRFQVAAEIRVTARPFGPGDAIDQANARENEDDFLAQQWATAYLKSEIYRVWPEE